MNEIITTNEESIKNKIFTIGASLKDLDKKWLSFSKFDMKSFDILRGWKGDGRFVWKLDIRLKYLNCKNKI